MQLIAVDIGNTAIKVVVQTEAANGRWCDQYVYRNSDPIQLDLPIAPAFWSICSVNHASLERLRRWILDHRPGDRIHLISEADITIRTNVESRKQVGCDRLIGAWMALNLSDNEGPLVLVDAGTAVTIDCVNEFGVFEGGLIFPGATVSLAQMSQAAEALPEYKGTDALSKIGNLERLAFGQDTEQAMLLGVYKAQLTSMQSIASSLVDQYDQDCTVYATGGGGLALEKYLPRNWKVVPDLVLRGVRVIGSKLLGRVTT
ncbi:MAG: type III pantothenate kinase [Mariniblastus sp.]|nr:type III pantothenate kinase [Mariniblastus sp.]